MQVKDGYPGRLDMKPEFRSACTALAPPTYARPFACIATMGCLRTSCTISQIRCLPCRQPMPHTAKRCGKGPRPSIGRSILVATTETRIERPIEGLGPFPQRFAVCGIGWRHGRHRICEIVQDVRKQPIVAMHANGLAYVGGASAVQAERNSGFMSRRPG